MMKFGFTGRVTVVLSVFLCIVFCNLNGGGSNTGNARVSGLLLNPSGNCVPHGIVSLYRSDAMPVLPDSGETPAVARDTSDAAGRYYFAAVDSGSYNILCQDSAGSLKALRYDRKVQHRDSVFDTIMLQGTTSLTGTITNPQPPLTVCFVPGSPYITLVNDTSGVFRLNNIPGGPYPVLFQNIDISHTDSSFVYCSYTYTLGQLPDTSIVVFITLNCQ
jgi:hypothetical protein